MASLLKCGISLFLIEARWHQLVYLPPSYGWGNRVIETARARAKSRAVMPLRQGRAEVSKAVLDKLTCLLAAAQLCWRTVSASASLSSAGAGTSAQQRVVGGAGSVSHLSLPMSSVPWDILTQAICLSSCWWQFSGCHSTFSFPVCSFLMCSIFFRRESVYKRRTPNL